jgi:uncharacterized membrane protein
MDTADAKKPQRRSEVKLHNRIDLLKAQGVTHWCTDELSDLDYAWNAVISINQQLFKHTKTTYNQLFGSRTPSPILCATVSARRLIEN